MHIHRFSTEDFLAAKDTWQTLLGETSSDPLFLSWDWLYSWWKVYAKKNFELLVLGAYDNGRLVCVTPLYLQKTKVKLGISSKRIEFLGTNTSGGAGFRSEYLQFIARGGIATDAINACLLWILKNIDFDEFALNDVVVSSPTFACINNLCSQKGFYKRVQANSTAYGVNTEKRFDAYIGSLGKNSRLQIFNRRKILESREGFSITHVDESNFEYILDKLGEFHLTRWNKKITYHQHKIFINTLISQSGKRVTGVILSLPGKIIGCTFDIDCGSRCYNFQLGFADDIDKKISMGSLTLGYGLERCFQHPKIKYYDLMAGKGKNSNYKTRFAHEGTRFESFQLIRSPILSLLYHFKDFLDSLKEKNLFLLSTRKAPPKIP